MKGRAYDPHFIKKCVKNRLRWTVQHGKLRKEKVYIFENPEDNRLRSVSLGKVLGTESQEVVGILETIQT